MSTSTSVNGLASAPPGPVRPDLGGDFDPLLPASCLPLGEPDALPSEDLLSTCGQVTALLASALNWPAARTRQSAGREHDAARTHLLPSVGIGLPSFLFFLWEIWKANRQKRRRSLMASVAPGPPRPSALSGRWSDVALGITWKEARRPAFKVPRQTRALYCCPQQTHHRRRLWAAPKSRMPRDSRASAAHDSLVRVAYRS